MILVLGAPRIDASCPRSFGWLCRSDSGGDADPLERVDVVLPVETSPAWWTDAIEAIRDVVVPGQPTPLGRTLARGDEPAHRNV